MRLPNSARNSRPWRIHELTIGVASAMSGILNHFRAMQEIFERRFCWTVRQVLAASQSAREEGSR